MSDNVIVRESIMGAAAWRGDDLTPADYLYELSDDEVATMEALRDDLMDRGLSLGQIDPETVPVPGMESASSAYELIGARNDAPV